MILSYRFTSLAVIVMFVAMWAMPESLTMRLQPCIGISGDSIVQLDLCFMWERLNRRIKLSALIWLCTVLAMVLQGLRNRTVSRLVALVSFLALVPVVHHDLWRMNPCESRVGVGMHVVWVAVVALMTLQHLVQRPK